MQVLEHLDSIGTHFLRVSQLVPILLVERFYCRSEIVSCDCGVDVAVLRIAIEHRDGCCSATTLSKLSRYEAVSSPDEVGVILDVFAKASDTDPAPHPVVVVVLWRAHRFDTVDDIIDLRFDFAYVVVH